VTKIEAGHYRAENGIEVFRSYETLHYSRALNRPNRWGDMSTANSRKVSSWTFKVGSAVVPGFGTKAQALTGARKFINRNLEG
jgi:hypothetical protein